MVKPTPDHSSFKFKLMNGFLAISLLANILYPLIPFKVFAANTGAIWTTRDDCGDETQNVNHYDHGEDVYINGANFESDEELDWEIEGLPGNASEDPGETVASGSLTADSIGNFCIFAYTVANDDGGEYKASVGNKSDNYSVDRPTASPTPTPTATPLVTPSITPSPTEEITPTPTPTEVISPTPTPIVTLVSSPTPTPTEEVTPTPTEEPSPTATPTEIVSPTPTPTDIPTPTPTIIIEENYVELLLTSICNENGQHKFRVRNQNSFDIDYSYELVGTAETGLGTATPGDSFFYVSSSQPGTTKIYYELNLQSKFTTKAQNTIECTPTVTSTPTQDPSPTPTPTEVPSPTPTPIVTLVSSPTPTPTEEVTPTPTPVVTATSTPVISPTPHPAPKVCPLVAGPGEILINIEGHNLWANIALSDAQYTVNGEIPSGTYQVSLASYDNHSTKPGQIQPKEEFFVILKDEDGNEVARTNAISDLPDNMDIKSEVVNNALVIGNDIKQLQPYHNDYPSQTNNANTIGPVCILLKPIDAPTVTPAPAVCPLVPQGDEILVNLKKNPIRADMGVDAANYMLSTDIPDGTYNIKLSSYDSHSLKPGQNQMHEKFYVILKDQNANEITRTNSISDLPEDQDLMFETVNNSLEINSDVKFVQPFHKAFASNIAESIEPLCMLLDPVESNNNPTPTPTGSDNQNPTPTPTLPIGDGEPTPTPTDSDNQNPTPTQTTSRNGSPNQGGIGDGGGSDDDDNNGNVQGDSTTSPASDEDTVVKIQPEGTVKGLARTGISLSIPMILGILNLLILGGTTFLIRNKTKLS